MDFYLVNNTKAANNQGTEISVTDRHFLTYKRGEKTLNLIRRADWLEGVIYVNYISFISPIQWNVPFQNEPISQDEIKLIKADIEQAMELFGCQVDFNIYDPNLATTERM